MLQRLRENVRESGYQEPLAAIEQDEVLRSMNHTIAYRVFLGWAITQGLVGSIMGMFFSDLLILGFTLVAFSCLATGVWLLLIMRKGLIIAAKEGTLESTKARRMSKIVALLQGVFFGVWTGAASALWMLPESGITVHVLNGVINGTMFGFMMWFVNGRIKRNQNEPKR